MRIIGGVYAKRIIRPPKNLPVRPTTDLAKESLFNILRNKITFENKKALDLFAGSGSLSYEFSSRGCDQVISVDSNFKCIQFIKKTANDFGMSSIKPLRSEVFRFIKTTKLKFDIIFADPPYQMDNINEISIEIFKNELLNPDGWLIIEHPKEITLNEQEYFFERRKYGHVNFSFFKISS
jgi:16S rRNA (guanine(966)-N(2))-methyltransferase RsmD